MPTAQQHPSPPAPASPLYSALRALALAHAKPDSLDHIMAIRAPHATHAWGHAGYLVARHPKLADVMDNAQFAAHIRSTGRYVAAARPSVVHDVVVDERKRRAVVRMSYFLRVDGGEKSEEGAEVVEQDLVWVLGFTSGEGERERERVLIEESVEFIDAAASARLGTLVREVYGEVGEDVRGGITLKES
ncbi:hypothetical protein MPH_10956 [Macrophomina phaseolina MS6]|uniref:Uncharacterized protein n=1 Tax=Macrophomina phaseolina (strain MS6) TaxID=1126212 RepID=K2RBH9_MACPH|nr:hypothetical protein MPH_10956 [Macrophomina phaseolina MS6]